MSTADTGHSTFPISEQRNPARFSSPLTVRWEQLGVTIDPLSETVDENLVVAVPQSGPDFGSPLDGFTPLVEMSAQRVKSWFGIAADRTEEAQTPFVSRREVEAAEQFEPTGSPALSGPIH